MEPAPSVITWRDNGSEGTPDRLGLSSEPEDSLPAWPIGRTLVKRENTAERLESNPFAEKSYAELNGVFLGPHASGDLTRNCVVQTRAECGRRSKRRLKARWWVRRGRWESTWNCRAPWDPRQSLHIQGAGGANRTITGSPQRDCEFRIPPPLPPNPSGWRSNHTHSPRDLLPVVEKPAGECVRCFGGQPHGRIGAFLD